MATDKAVMGNMWLIDSGVTRHMCNNKARTKLMTMNLGLAGNSRGRPAGMIMAWLRRRA